MKVGKERGTPFRPACPVSGIFREETDGRNFTYFRTFLRTTVPVSESLVQPDALTALSGKETKIKSVRL